MQKGDEASPSISLAGHGYLVKIALKTLEPHGIFYLLIHWYAKKGQGFAEKFDCRPTSTPHEKAFVRVFRPGRTKV